MPKDAFKMLLSCLPNLPPIEVRDTAISIATERILFQRLHPGLWIKISDVVITSVKQAWKEYGTRYNTHTLSIDDVLPNSDGTRFSETIRDSEIIPPSVREHHKTPKKPYKRKRRYYQCANSTCRRRFVSVRKAVNVKFCSHSCQVESAEHRSNTKLLRRAVVADIESGLTVKKIADKYDVSDSSVRQFIKRHQLSRPKLRSEECLDCSKPPERGYARCRLHRRLADARRQREYKRRKYQVKPENYHVL